MSRVSTESFTRSSIDSISIGRNNDQLVPSTFLHKQLDMTCALYPLVSTSSACYSILQIA